MQSTKNAYVTLLTVCFEAIHSLIFATHHMLLLFIKVAPTLNFIELISAIRSVKHCHYPYLKFFISPKIWETRDQRDQRCFLQRVAYRKEPGYEVGEAILTLCPFCLQKIMNSLHEVTARQVSFWKTLSSKLFFLEVQ